MAATRHEFGEHGGVNLSIEASTTFTVLAANMLPGIFRGEHGPFAQRDGSDNGGCYLYGRHFNPTVFTFGRFLAALEGTEAAYATASGMAAISCAILQLCDAGDRVVSANAIYGGTFALFRDYLPRKAGIETTFAPLNDHAAIAAALVQTAAKVLYVESLANPTLEVADIPALAAIAHAAGAKLVVDNTFAPVILSPAMHGADVVVHSVTKFISGGSDIIAGAVCGSEAFVTQLMDLHTGSIMLLGPTMDPKVAHELTLRLPHLGVRIREHGRRALAYAERLEALGVAVGYPGLPSHPSHALLERLASPGYGAGGVLTVDLGSIERANRFMEILQNEHRFGFMAVSLGYFETLMSASGSSTSSELSPEEQAAAGISPGLVRISVGLTGHLEQRLDQLEDAVARSADG